MIVPPYFSGTKPAKIICFFRAHKRVSVITFSWVAFWAFHVVHNWRDLGPFYLLVFFAGFVMLIPSQLFWIGRVLDLGERFIPGKSRRLWLAVIATVAYNFAIWYHPRGGDSTHLTLRGLLLDGAWPVWLVGSIVGFGLVIVFWTADRTTHAAAWVFRKARKAAAGHAAAPMPGAIALDPPSPARRRLLEQTAVAMSTAPFLAAAYGLFYGRLDVDVTRPRIRLARLPKAFEGFRIAQLSDFHISPFMTGDEIRRCVTMANGLKTDLVVLTGDYLADDPQAQNEVVQELAGLRAPYGVFGCLGNHEMYTETEDSITRLFAAEGIRILRQERAPIQLGGATVNLMGIDDPRGETDEEWIRDLYHRLHKGLVMPGTVNILLAHEPSDFMFDRAAELGIDLTLAGHTHGG
jgi:predicted MPP superfamily phosphohydrolase